MKNLSENKVKFIGRPFYIFITILVGFLGGNGVSAFLQAGQSFYAVVTLFLVVFHIGLYWLNMKYSMKYDADNRWRIFYYIAQAAIITIFTLLPYPGGSDIGLSILGSAAISIIAEGLGLWGNSRRALLIGILYAGLLVVLFSLKIEADLLLPALSQLMVNGVFIILIMFVLNQQFAERQKAEELAESLEVANAKLAAYAARNEALTLQAERERMARELHDTLAQGVAGLVMQLEAIKAHQQQGQYPEAEQVVVRALSRARNTLKESRSAIEDLRNEDGNFQHTIESLLKEFRSAGQTTYTLNIDLTDEKKIPQDIQHHVRRVLHEALTNAQRHAQAKNVQLSLLQKDGTLVLTVQDDGVGFDVPNIPVGHFGLQGLQERAQLTSSQYTLLSAVGEGTKIEFIFPLFTGESA